MAALETIWQQAQGLSEEERSELATRLLRSLAPADDELSEADWQAAWTEEIDRRVREIRAGTATLVDGDEVFRQVRDRIASHRR